MKLKYYVLWRKDNPIIQEYLDKYYQKLIAMLKDIKNSWYMSLKIKSLLWVENKNFILSGDISSLIQILHTELIQEGKTFNLEKPELYILQLEEQIGYFLKGDQENLIINKGQKIGSTNIRITAHDYNPFSGVISHPDHKKFGVDRAWWDFPESWWIQSYTRSFEILKTIDEWIYDELNQIIGKIIPFWTALGCHNSCSHKECVGHLYLWYTLDSTYPEIDNLEAIIHESSHNKLNLIMQSEKIILNDLQEKYYSPYRPDARHIHGIYIGIHAFVPVVYVMMKSYMEWFLWESQDALHKIILYYLKNKFTYKVLRKYGNFSPLGEEILSEVAYIMRLTDKIFLSIPNHKEILFRVSGKQKEHFRQVNINYPHLQY